MSSIGTEARHPILGCADALEARLKDVAGLDPTFMRTAEKAEALLALARVETQLAGLRMRLMAASSDVAAEDAARDVAAWLAHRTRTDRGRVWGDLRLADALDRYHPHLQAAVTHGRVNCAQARVIVRSLAELPDDLDPDLHARAEQTLIGYADRFAPTQLRALGRKILEVIAPETADEHEARILENEERRAEEHTSLTLTALGNGTTRITGKLPDTTATRLKTILDAFTSPRHEAITGTHDHPSHDTPATPPGLVPPADRIPRARKLGHALRALLEHLDPTTLPRHGGDTTTIIITISLDQLLTEHGVAELIDTDHRQITAAHARRLACQAHLIPAVLGTDSEILDLGRSARLFNPAQRKALRLRDQHCRAQGCTVPATWCEAHHRNPWSHGGTTNLNNGTLLCSFHHHRTHDPTHHTTHHPNGDVTFHRRQ